MIAASTITSLPAPEGELGQPGQEQRRLAGALHDVVAGREQRAAAEGEDHRIGVQRPQAAVAQPGDAEVQLRPGQLRGDDHAHQHAHHAPQHGGQRKPAHHRIACRRGPRCGTDVLVRHRILSSGDNFTGCRRIVLRALAASIDRHQPRSGPAIEDALAFALEVLELAPVQGPAEDRPGWPARAAADNGISR